MRFLLLLALCLIAPATLAQADRAADILRALDERSDRVEEARRDALAATEGQPPFTRQAALADAIAPFRLHEEDTRLATAIADETETAVLQALLLNYISVETDLEAKDATLGLQALREIGPSHELWSHRPPLVHRALALAAREDAMAATVAAESIFEQHPDTTVQAYVLLHGLETAHEARNEGRAQAYFDLLQEDRFYETEPGLIAWSVFQRYATRIRVGAPVPDFTMTLLDIEETVSRASLLGSVYLIDFWAVWCAPCIHEMPTLHAAYERFGEHGFEILSVSMDDSADAVHDFRGERFPMPWLNVWVEDGFGGEIAQAFEIRALPKPILVGPDGTILATSSVDLRGASLEKTLAGLLGEGETP